MLALSVFLCPSLNYIFGNNFVPQFSSFTNLFCFSSFYQFAPLSDSFKYISIIDFIYPVDYFRSSSLYIYNNQPNT